MVAKVNQGQHNRLSLPLRSPRWVCGLCVQCGGAAAEVSLVVTLLCCACGAMQIDLMFPDLPPSKSVERTRRLEGIETRLAEQLERAKAKRAEALLVLQLGTRCSAPRCCC